MKHSRTKSFSSWFVRLVWDNPLSRLELAVANRSMVYWIAIVVFLFAGIAAGLSALVAGNSSFFQGRIPVNQLPSLGIKLYWILFAIQSLIMLFLVLRIAGKTIYAERQLKTWHMLFLSRLTPMEIVFGKFSGVMIPVLIFMGATLPIYSICLLLGGISIVQIGLNFIALAGLAALLTIFGLYNSAWKRVRGSRRGASGGVILAIVFFVFLGIPIFSSIASAAVFAANTLGQQPLLLYPVFLFGRSTPLWVWLAPIWIILMTILFFATKQKIRHPAALKTPWPRFLSIIGICVALSSGIGLGRPQLGRMTEEALAFHIIIWSIAFSFLPMILFGMGPFDFPRLAETPRWDRWVGRRPVLSLPVRWLYPSHTGGLVTALVILAIILAPFMILAEANQADVLARAIMWLMVGSTFYVIAYWAMAGIIGSYCHQLNQVRANLFLLILIPGLIFVSPSLINLWKMLSGQPLPRLQIFNPIWDATPPSAFWIAAVQGDFSALHQCCKLFAAIAIAALPFQFMRWKKIYAQTVIHAIDG
jgi:hypothetical protein